MDGPMLYIMIYYNMLKLTVKYALSILCDATYTHLTAEEHTQLQISIRPDSLDLFLRPSPDPFQRVERNKNKATKETSKINARKYNIFWNIIYF